MYKNIIKLSIVILVACSFFYTQNRFKLSHELLLANLEALASGESGGTYCYGYGSVDCHGYKVSWMASGV